MSPRRVFPLLGLCCLVLGCGPRPDSNPPPVSLECNVLTEVCGLPFPSSVLVVPDPSTETGMVFEISEAMDFAGMKERFDSETYGGFSIIGAIVTWLPEGGLEEDVPTDYEESLAPGASVLLVNADATSESYGRRHPFTAELVPSEEGGGQLLIVTPLEAFDPSSRYAVVVTSELRSSSGDALEPSASQRGLLGLGQVAPGQEELAEYYKDLRYLVRTELGVPLRKVVQLWDFHTRPQSELTGDFDAVRASTEAWLAENPPTMLSVEGSPLAGHTRYDFAFEVPLWHADRFDPLTRDEQGLPVPVGVTELAAYMVVPATASEETPATSVIFGHGLGAHSNLMEVLISGLPLDEGPLAVTAFDWDLHGSRGLGITDILEITGTMNYAGFSASMMQNASDALVMSELLASAPVLPDHGAVLSPGPLLYLGQSLGSLAGVPVLAVSDRFEAGVLNVGGGGLSTILRRGEVVDQIGMRPALESLVASDPPTDFPADLGYHVLLIMGQLGLDGADPMSFALHVQEDRLDGGEPPAILLQESTGDGIIPNLTSHTLARQIGLPLAEPSDLGAPGLETTETPTCGSPSSALAQLRVSFDSFQAHVALENGLVQDQAMVFLNSFVDDDPSNDGNIITPSLTGSWTCP